MSILIALAQKDYVAVCTDCQHTHLETGLPGELGLQKIEKFSDKLYIAHGGSPYMAHICMEVLQKFYKNGVISDISITDPVEALIGIYEYMIQTEPEIEEKTSSTFIVAGILDSGNMGLGIVENTPSGVISRFVEGNDKTQIELFQPTDMEKAECLNILTDTFSQAKHTDFFEQIEWSLRETVKSVSQKSRYVSEESLFYTISLNDYN